MISAVAPARVRPAPISAIRERLDPGLALALALGLCAAVPVIAATVQALVDGWLPAGDQANIATRAYDVFTSRSSLVGLHSDASAAINHDVYSLGPMLFWLLSLPARLASPGWMTLTMGLVNAASIVGFDPAASMAWSTPPEVSSSTVPAASRLDASTKSLRRPVHG